MWPGALLCMEYLRPDRNAANDVEVVIAREAQVPIHIPDPVSFSTFSVDFPLPSYCVAQATETFQLFEQHG